MNSCIWFECVDAPEGTQKGYGFMTGEKYPAKACVKGYTVYDKRGRHCVLNMDEFYKCFAQILDAEEIKFRCIKAAPGLSVYTVGETYLVELSTDGIHYRVYCAPGQYLTVKGDDLGRYFAEVHDPSRCPFQSRVASWMGVCFGSDISKDCVERNHRFLEEALELVQACECTASEAHQLVDYVFNRPVGEKGQEVGGVKVTLAALCSAQSIDHDLEGERELLRIWTKIGQIQLKQALKPKHSPLPE